MKQAYTAVINALFKYRTAAGIFLLIACCAPPPPMLEEPVKRYWEVGEPLKSVWEATLQALVDKGVIISILDKEDHLIVAEEVLEKGNIRNLIAERGVFESGTARLTFLLSEKSETTTGIQINSVIEGFTGGYNVYATSNGKLEKDYFFSITNNLPEKKHYPWLEDDTADREEGIQEEHQPDDTEQSGVKGTSSQGLP